MSRKKTQTFSSQRVKVTGSSIMTVCRKNDTRTSKTQPSSPSKKLSPWPINLSNSSSLDGNSRATSSSWPEEIEEAATRKVLELWYAVERTLYKEDEQVPLGDLMEECIQWRTQIPHFRVIGRCMTLQIAQEDCEVGSCLSAGKSNSSIEKNTDVPLDSTRSNKSSSATRQQLIESRDQMIDRLLEFIYVELEKNDDDDDDDDNNEEAVTTSSRDLDEMLRITPAPTYSGRHELKHRDMNNKLNSRNSSSANKYESFELTELTTNVTSMRTNDYAKNTTIDSNTVDNADDHEDESDDSIEQHGRNKLGTVFNEKIVVSPVPYAVTTRESFCTLKTTPIRYAGHLLELNTPQGLVRKRNSASKVNTLYRTSLQRLPQRHSAWQASVCPAVWPKNVRLAPIDPSRLPSSKNRSSAISTSVTQRNRNSLSPISRPLKTTSASDSLNNVDFLGIQGKQIVTRSAMPNLLTSEWDRSLHSLSKSVRKKTRSKSDR